MVSSANVRTLMRRVACFAVIGFGGGIVYYGALLAMVELIGWPVMLSTCTAFVGVLCMNYWLHRIWTFRSNASVAHTLVPYAVMGAAGFFINAGVMWLGVVTGSDYRVVQGIAIVAVVSWNYVCTTRIFHTSETSAIFAAEGADHAVR